MGAETVHGFCMESGWGVAGRYSGDIGAGALLAHDHGFDGDGQVRDVEAGKRAGCAIQRLLDGFERLALVADAVEDRVRDRAADARRDDARSCERGVRMSSE